jgi:sulfur carrier protein
MTAEQVTHLLVNSEKLTCRASNLAQLLVELNYADAVVATALNGHFVAQQKRDKQILEHGDQVEILAPMQGG